MLDLFLAVIERAVKLSKGRVLARKQLFTTYFDPTFVATRKVHEEYGGLLLGLIKEVQKDRWPKLDPDKVLKIARDIFSDERMRLGVEHKRLIAMMHAIPESGIKSEEKAFATSLLDYFKASFPAPDLETDLVELLESSVFGQLNISPEQTTFLTDLTAIQGFLDAETNMALLRALSMQGEFDTLAKTAEYFHFMLRHKARKWKAVCKAFANLKIAVDMSYSSDA